MKRPILKQKQLKTVFDITSKKTIFFRAIRDNQNYITGFEHARINNAIEPMSERSDEKYNLFVSTCINSRDSEIFKKLVHVVNTGETLDTIFCLPGEGVNKWLCIIAHKFQDGILVSLDDVTEKKFSEERVNELTHFIETVAVTTPDVIHVMDIEKQKVVYANRTMYEDIGYTASEIKEMTSQELLLLHHPDDRDKVLAFRESFKSANDDDVNECIGRALAKDGNWVWFRNRGRVFKRDEMARPTHYMMISRNITKEKMAEEALNESRKLIDHVMLYTPDLIIVTDAETNLVLYTNRNLFEGVDRSDYTSEELLGLNVLELMRLLLNPKDWPSFREFIESLRLLDDDDIIQLEYCVQTHDSKWEWLVTRSKVFKRDPEGRAREIISFTNSIDRKKHSDETITHLIEVLINKNEKLESLNSELKTLSNIAAHDYIDTLRSTYTQLEYIILNDARNLSDAGKASIRRSQSGIQKMKLLTEDLVAYTQIPFLEDQVSPVDLNEVLRNVLDNMSKKIYETEASIVCDRLPTIPGISNLFFLLFYHLIDNSIKFKRKSDKPFIQITHKQVDRIPGKTSLSNGIYDTVTVTDNGIGFEKKDAESIFIIFHRLHDKFKYKGSGIGLAICKKIMEVQNGFIIASSVPGKGASFNCFFQQIKEANYVSFL